MKGVAHFLLFVSALFIASCSLPVVRNTAIPHDNQQKFRVMTLNVMQAAPESRRSRFARIVDFIDGQSKHNNPVHALLLQELGSGWLNLGDSGKLLAGMLADKGYEYNYYSVPNLGFPGIMTFRVGILINNKMLFTQSRLLKCKLKTPSIAAIPLPGKKNVAACGVDIPGLGRLNLISVHVYAATSVAEKVEQLKQLVNFAEELNQQFPAETTIIGGDFNCRPPIAEPILNAAGYRDTYLELHPDRCSPEDNYSGCTAGVYRNPFGAGIQGKGEVVDYIFMKSSEGKVTKSEVAFNGLNGPFVSDHCGILTEISLPAAPE